MTKEDKKLLHIDLCARLPYGVIVYDYDREETREMGLATLHDIMFNDLECKPYLRPMSSMTEEEGNEYRMFIEYSYNDFTSESTPCVYIDKIENYINWLNKHHFDYNGLIPMGLALEALEGMYNIK